MTIPEWKENPTNIAAARKALDEPVIKMMLQIISDSTPVPALPLQGSQPTDYSYSYGILVGWRTAIATIRSMAESQAEAQEISPDFAPDNNR